MERICKWAALVICGLLAVLTILLVLPGLFHIHPLIVKSGSMEPTYPVGSLIYVKPMDEAKLEEGAAKAKAAMTLDKTDAESIANEKTGVDAIQKQTAGDFAVAEENARMIRERRDAKCSNAKLRTEMKVKAAKEKIAVRREELDKAAQEDWILDLLDYANGCYEMAYAWALEAEYTMMEAAYEIDYYTRRFGPDEEKK